MTEYDFLIYCTQRSGSHMLASALNSHPDISCRGEVLTAELLPKEDPLIAFSDNGITGGILMYKHAPAFGRLLVAPKIIHLVRNSYDVARSMLANKLDKKEKKEDHASHFFEHASRKFELKGSVVDRRVLELKRSVHEARSWIQDINHIEISYEEITGNKSISSLDPGASKCLTDFLAVPQATLVTDFVKPDTVYTIKRK